MKQTQEPTNFLTRDFLNLKILNFQDKEDFNKEEISSF